MTTPTEATAEEKRVIVEFECLKKDIEDVPGFDHYPEQRSALLKTKVATALIDNGFRYVNVKRISDKDVAQRLSELKEGLSGLETFYTWDEAGKQVLTNKEEVVRLKDVTQLIEEVSDG